MVNIRSKQNSMMMRPPLLRAATLLLLLLLTRPITSVQAQSMAEPVSRVDLSAINEDAPFFTRTDLHANISIPSGFQLEGSVGTIIAAVTFNFGINYHRGDYPNLTAEYMHPTWGLLATYFRSAGINWYGLTANYGLLQLGLSGVHATLRAGATLLMKAEPNTSVLLYPLPSIDLGIAWAFPSR
jgi:hypothetical protein